MLTQTTILLGLALSGAKPAATPTSKPAPAPAAVEPDAATLALFGALPAVVESPKNPLGEAKITLGRMLYFDTRLSKNHDISCNSCHGLNTFGVDGQQFSDGHKKVKGGRNAPTVYNAAGHVAQFWDGRAADVEEQAKGPVLNPKEMAMPSEAVVVETMKSIPGYVDAFKAAFPGEKEPMTYDNMGKAIGAFERKLMTPSRFDRFLGGQKDALTADEKKGLDTFVKTGCTACHMGTFVGGTMYQKAGLVKPWPSQADPGRFEVTKNEADRMMFKVPSLRNIEKTAPYFHDGSVKGLDEAVKMMARHQLGKELSDEETRSVVTFLKALTGEVPAAYVAQPKLPASGPKTRKPDPT